ncbi:hypothetical protein ANCCEY_00933 [Ancylostoma ceylanicum]|uniref:Uncharacterized protein n=1 Tax=Ancylostoma ceylanicum TaxID=53326 RepID=A0A0D6M757_9BILA|nr:hypothetical protein ANCCEY_00933 [Ancylostoma ceylanicum]
MLFFAEAQASEALLGNLITCMLQEWYPKEDLEEERPRSARESQEYNENLEEILQELAKQNQALKQDDLGKIRFIECPEGIFASALAAANSLSCLRMLTFTNSHLPMSQHQNKKLRKIPHPVPGEVEIELQKTKELPKETAGRVAGTEKSESQPDVVEEQPLVAQKKGQNEFVSFVEPVDAKQTKSVATLEKRRLAGASEFSNSLPTYSSNLLMIAVGTVLIVGMVASVVGGGYYIKRRRSSPDDSEYAPYAGTGPGFKKNKGDKGDESLAYKAQLHQYQQAKQKIICGEDAPAGLESDGEDDGADDENNFSVYECPGLAPTGDIEVCNPNFAAHP